MNYMIVLAGCTIIIIIIIININITINNSSIITNNPPKTLTTTTMMTMTRRSNLIDTDKTTTTIMANDDNRHHHNNNQKRMPSRIQHHYDCQVVGRRYSSTQRPHGHDQFETTHHYHHYNYYHNHHHYKDHNQMAKKLPPKIKLFNDDHHRQAQLNSHLCEITFTNEHYGSITPLLHDLTSSTITPSEGLSSTKNSFHHIRLANVHHNHQHIHHHLSSPSPSFAHYKNNPTTHLDRSSTTKLQSMTTAMLKLPFTLKNSNHSHLSSILSTPIPLSESSPSTTTTMTTTKSTSTMELTEFSSILTMDTILTLILPYSIIFILSIVGNLLVIITLTLDRSMRSVTNIFLLNLSISDLLLGVFCMPFTLVGVLLRRFIFGAFMCHLISYFQAVSVAVSVWTLVAMSIERYYAICHPFRSRESRQTKKHAYRILAMVWTLAFITMSPTAIVSKLQLTSQTGHYKCREAWPSFLHKQVFTIFLDFVLLVIPLIIMILTYSSIALTLRNNVQRHQDTIKHSKLKSFTGKCSPNAIGKTSGSNFCKTTSFNNGPNQFYTKASSPASMRSKSMLLESGVATTLPFSENSFRDSSDSINQSNIPKRFKNGTTTNNNSTNNNSNQLQVPRTMLRVNSSPAGPGSNRQRRIITMLFVVVIEFFICWSPIFLLDTMALYRPAMVYGTSKKVSQWIGIDIISLCHLLCFCSSCTNPITYCFMNRRFRDHFMSLFRCRTVSSSNPSTSHYHYNINNNNSIAQNMNSSIIIHNNNNNNNDQTIQSSSIKQTSTSNNQSHHNEQIIISKS